LDTAFNESLVDTGSVEARDDNVMAFSDSAFTMTPLAPLSDPVSIEMPFRTIGELKVDRKTAVFPIVNFRV